jgi:hypothetical protein
MALVQACYPELSEDQRANMVQRLCTQRTLKPVSLDLKTMSAVAGHLSDEDFGAFKDEVYDEMRTTLIQKRCGVPRKQAEATTPECLKSLRPTTADGQVPKGCYFVWQISHSTYEGYYAKTDGASGNLIDGKVKGSWSTARTYGKKWSQLSALTQVVNQLWKWHRKKGQETHSSFRPHFIHVGTTLLCQPQPLPH